MYFLFYQCSAEKNLFQKFGLVIIIAFYGVFIHRKEQLSWLPKVKCKGVA
jgi:hypothetical protein